MDIVSFLTTYYVLLGGSYIITIAVGILGWVCLTPKKMLMKVFPYIKKSGNDIVVFDFLIEEKYIKLYYAYLMYIVQSTLFLFLFNAFLTVSFKYNPYDDLDCFANYINSSEIKIESEEQAEMNNVTFIRCFGWKLEIGGAAGRAAAILALSWIFSSIILWIKLNLNYKARNYIKEGKKIRGYCGLVWLFLFRLFFFLCYLTAYLLPFVFVFLFNIPQLSINDIFDLGLIGLVLCSGIGISPGNKKVKILARCCKDVVENKQKGQEEDITQIRNRLAVDHLVDQAEIKCQKVLADMEEDKREKEWDIVNEDEMRKIVQAAYRKIAPNDEEEKTNEQTATTAPTGSEGGQANQEAIEESSTTTERSPLLRNAK
uniref:Uncharacterized protein n=1 Tax=Amphimedon queenslandica TaxID=400682 RepID=A0A1X7TIB6_AMPQE